MPFYADRFLLWIINALGRERQETLILCDICIWGKWGVPKGPPVIPCSACYNGDSSPPGLSTHGDCYHLLTFIHMVIAISFWLTYTWWSLSPSDLRSACYNGDRYHLQTCVMHTVMTITWSDVWKHIITNTTLGIDTTGVSSTQNLLRAPARPHFVLNDIPVWCG